MGYVASFLGDLCVCLCRVFHLLLKLLIISSVNFADLISFLVPTCMHVVGLTCLMFVINLPVLGTMYDMLLWLASPCSVIVQWVCRPLSSCCMATLGLQV